MSSYKVFEKEIVRVKSSLGREGYAFFQSVEHGDVFFHESALTEWGFCKKDLVVGSSAIIDIKVDAKGKQCVGKIHLINSRIGLSVRQNQRTVRQSKLPHLRQVFPVGTRARGRVTAVKQSFGFIEAADYMNLFFAMSCVPARLIPFLKEGVEVKFDVEACKRGVMGRVSDIVWTELQLRFELVTSNERKNLHIYRRADPTGKIQYEVRKHAEGKKFCVIAERLSYPAAKRYIAEAQFLHLVVNRAKRPAAG